MSLSESGLRGMMEKSRERRPSAKRFPPVGEKLLPGAGSPAGLPLLVFFKC